MPRLRREHPEHFVCVDDALLECGDNVHTRVMNRIRLGGVEVNYDVLRAQYFVPRWAFMLAADIDLGIDQLTTAVLVGALMPPVAAEEFARAVLSVVALGNVTAVDEFVSSYTNNSSVRYR